MYLDDGGMGVGVFDHLLKDSQTRRKVVAINNSSRSIDRESKRKKLLKEDLYVNTLKLMQSRKLKLWNDDRIAASLMSVQAEETTSGLKIFGTNTHIAEALIRACWCTRDKGLKIWIR